MYFYPLFFFLSSGHRPELLASPSRVSDSGSHDDGLRHTYSTMIRSLLKIPRSPIATQSRLVCCAQKYYLQLNTLFSIATYRFRTRSLNLSPNAATQQAVRRCNRPCRHVIMLRSFSEFFNSKSFSGIEPYPAHSKPYT